MNKNILNISILIVGILVVGAITSPVFAKMDDRTTPEISYPVTELGNCADKTACKAYCDKQDNVDACLSFAEKNNLMSKEEIKTAKSFKKTGMIGPGGCKGKNECTTYCSGPDHMDECISFAEKNGLMSGEKLDEAKKVKAAISKGIKPPACGGKENCKDYCSSSEHVEECVKFGEAAGIIKKEDAEMIRKNGGKRGPGDSDVDGRQGQEGQDRRGDQGNGDQKRGPGGGGGGNRGGGRQVPGDQGGSGDQDNGGGKRSPGGSPRGGGGQGQNGQGSSEGPGPGQGQGPDGGR